MIEDIFKIDIEKAIDNYCKNSNSQNIEKAIDNYCKNSNSQNIEKWLKEVGLW